MKKKLLQYTVVTVIWIAIWQGVYLLINQEILLASPLTVLERFFALVGTSSFWRSIGESILRISIGYLIGVLLGAGFSVLAAISPFLYKFLRPILVISRATPVSSFTILVLFWFKTGLVPVVISAIMVIGIVWDAVEAGIGAVNIEYLEMAQAFGFSAFKKARHIYYPTALPFFTSAARTCIGVAWKSGIAAEIICHPKYGIGTALYHTKVYLLTADMLAWTFTVILLSLALEYLINLLLKWQEMRQQGGHMV